MPSARGLCSNRHAGEPGKLCLRCGTKFLSRPKIYAENKEELSSPVWDRAQHQQTHLTPSTNAKTYKDHYHTLVQPIKDREILPEQHIHQMAAVEECEQYHSDDAAVRARLEQERLQLQNTHNEGAVHGSQSIALMIAGEHIHNHVHKTIQPMIQKETIEPSDVHTTIPVHKSHNNEAKHLAATALPAVSLADFKKQSGSLSSSEEHYNGFKHEPRAVGSALGGSSTTGLRSLSSTGTSGMTSTTGHHSHHSIAGNAGSTTANLENKLDTPINSLTSPVSTWNEEL